MSRGISFYLCLRGRETKELRKMNLSPVDHSGYTTYTWARPVLPGTFRGVSPAVAFGDRVRWGPRSAPSRREPRVAVADRGCGGRRGRPDRPRSPPHPS